MRKHAGGPRAAFGALLGVGPGGVEVFSSDYDSADKAALPNRQAYRSAIDGVFMGYKWQCVELARRWMYLTCGYVFDDVAMAYDIFRLREVRVLADGSRLPLRSFRNGCLRAPEPGALMIWNEGGEFAITGHVAVVTALDDAHVYVIEQNVEDRVWTEGTGYSRALPLGRGADGGYRVGCTFADASILGWVIQTDDDRRAQALDEPEAALFRPALCEAPREAKPAGWLEPARPEDAAYIEHMRGQKLATDPADHGRYFVLSETCHRELKRATNELHAMFMHATNFVLQDDALLAAFNLPEALWPRIHRSWDNRRNEMITGRFDFSVSERGIKVYEYNCDSASCHMECGRVQGLWAGDCAVTEGRCAGEPLFERLVEAWREAEVDGVLHIMRDNDLEEIYHALYMRGALEAAGVRTKMITGVEGLGWSDEGRVVDADGERIDWVWKTWAWETALDQLRHELEERLDEDATRLPNAPPAERRKRPPRLSDVLLHEEVMVYEPLWTLVPSNKAILPVLWMLYPNHPYLLNSGFELSGALLEGGYVEKPIVGRCGSNISLYDARRALIGSTGGAFGARDQIYQALWPLPVIDGRSVQIGTFTAAGSLGGACVRLDASPIIRSDSDMLALRVLDDAAFQNLPQKLSCA